VEKLSDVIDSVVVGNISETKEAVRRALDGRVTAMEIIDKGLVAGLDVVGDRFATGEMFLPEMILSAIAVRGGIEVATEGLKIGEYKPKATMVIGTVKGDLHDIGKNLVVLILRCRGFEVIDLGVDVHEGEFISVARERKAEFLGMSCLMTTTMISMKNVMAALSEAKLRDTVKVIIGGCSVTQDFASQIGADGCARDAVAAAILAERLLTEIRG